MKRTIQACATLCALSLWLVIYYIWVKPSWLGPNDLTIVSYAAVAFGAITAVLLAIHLDNRRLHGQRCRQFGVKPPTKGARKAPNGLDRSVSWMRQEEEDRLARRRAGINL